MHYPFFILWMSLLVGVAGGIWPAATGVWLALCTLFFIGRFSKVMISVGFMVGLLRAFLFFHLQEYPPNLDEKTHRYEAQILERNRYGLTARVQKIDSIAQPHLIVYTSGSFSVGDVVVGKAHLKTLSSFEHDLRLPPERLHLASGLVGKLKWDGPPKRVGHEFSLRDKIRQKIFQLAKSEFQALEGLRRALLVGDSTGISPDAWKGLNYLGLSHALVISGSHLSFLILLFGALSQKLFGALSSRRYRLARTALVSFIGIFYFVCNQDASINRALFCFLLVAAAPLILPKLHRYPKSEILSLVGAAMLFLNPSFISSVGYALSFGATWALLRAYEWKLPSSNLIPYFMIAPICASFAFLIHPFSPFINLLFLPIFFFLITPVAFLSMAFPSLEVAANRLVETFFYSVEALTELLSLYTPTLHWGMFGSVICLLLAILLFHLALNPRLRLSLLIFLVFGFQVLVFFPNHFTHQTNVGLKVRSVDIGEGDAFMIQMDELNILLDGGGSFGSERQLYSAILRDFDNKIDLWVVSHFDKDHLGNGMELGNILKAREIWAPRPDHSKGTGFLKAKGVDFVGRKIRQLCSKNFCVVSWMDPSRLFTRTAVSNDDSIALLIIKKDTQGLVAVFLGDLAKRGEMALISHLTQSGYHFDDGISILKAGHHGSKTSSSAELIKALQPKTVLISSGRNNRFRHPHSSVLNRFESLGIMVLRVDILANLKVFFDF